jgi:predicted ATPase
MWKSYATITRGWALVAQGQQEEAIRQMRQGLLGLKVLRAEVARPHFLALLAEVLGKANQAEEGLQAVKEALEMARGNQQLTYLAELHRIKGELLLIKARMRDPQLMVDSASPEVTEAELCFNEAVKVAREQKAKAWELRACMSLARIYKNRGQQQEARQFLSQIYHEFTEGFDTMDLREAKELLDELS